MWHVVKDLCDNGCWLVVLVRCTATGRTLAYCRDCGAAWLSPADLRANDFTTGSELCSRGIEVPGPEEVARSPWADSVLELVPVSEYSTASEINAALAREQSTAALKLAPRRASAGTSLSCARRWLGIAAGLASWFHGRSGAGWFQGSPSVVDRLRRARQESRRDA
jgi:hypothetical protein